jgi:hypothetical protein
MKQTDHAQLLDRLRDLPDEIAPGRDLWPGIERAMLQRPDNAPRRARVLRMSGTRTLVAAATVVALVAAVAILVLRTRDNVPGAPAVPTWTVEMLEGQAPSGGLRTLQPGDVLSTGSTDRLLATTDIGEVIVEPSTNVLLKHVSDELQVLTLNRGEIYARIVAPPRVFVVETPTVTAIDLGCEYRLSVDESGYGRLEVFAGWVALDHNDREWYVPAGAVAAMNGQAGPAAPYFADASPDFKAAADRYAASNSAADLDVMLSAARPFESLTLWHIALGATAEERGSIFDTLSRLGVIPDGYVKEDFVTLRPAAIDWLSAHLQESAWFRPDLFFGSTDDITTTKKKPATPGRMVR